MDLKIYIRACVLFIFDQGENTEEAKFREGNWSLQDLPRTGHLQILDRKCLKAAVYADSDVTSRELVGNREMEFRCCQRTIIDFS